MHLKIGKVYSQAFAKSAFRKQKKMQLSNCRKERTGIDGNGRKTKVHTSQVGHIRVEMLFGKVKKLGSKQLKRHDSRTEQFSREIQKGSSDYPYQEVPFERQRNKKVCLQTWIIRLMRRRSSLMPSSMRSSPTITLTQSS